MRRNTLWAHPCTRRVPQFGEFSEQRNLKGRDFRGPLRFREGQAIWQLCLPNLRLPDEILRIKACGVIALKFPRSLPCASVRRF